MEWKSIVGIDFSILEFIYKKNNTELSIAFN